MVSPANHEQLPLAPESGNPGFLLRDTADINRLFIHLVTHWRQPRVEFQLDGLHVVHSQRAQDCFARLSETCNCLLGEILAAATLLAGSMLTWMSVARSWHDMGWVLFFTLYVGLAGKGLELAWTRLKLLRVLLGLRRQLGSAEDSPERAVVLTVKAPPLDKRFSREPAAAAEVSRNNRVLHPILLNRTRRSMVLLRDTADITRLLRRLATRWTLPRIELRIDALPPLDAQRAQASIVHLSAGCGYLPAAVMSMAVLLSGLFHAIWTDSQNWAQMQSEGWSPSQLGWSDVQWVVLATLCVAVAGGALEAAWMRMRLLQLLRELRDRIPL